MNDQNNSSELTQKSISWLGDYFREYLPFKYFSPPLPTNYNRPYSAVNSGQNINYFGRQRNGDIIITEYKIVNMKVFKIVKRTRRRQRIKYNRKSGEYSSTNYEDEEEVVEEYEYECGYVEVDGSVRLYLDQQQDATETSYYSGLKNPDLNIETLALEPYNDTNTLHEYFKKDAMNEQEFDLV